MKLDDVFNDVLMAYLKLSLQGDQVGLEALVAADEAEDRVEIAAEVVRNGHVLLLDARQRLGHVAVEAVDLAGRLQLLVARLHRLEQRVPRLAVVSGVVIETIFFVNDLRMKNRQPPTPTQRRRARGTRGKRKKKIHHHLPVRRNQRKKKSKPTKTVTE